MAKGVVRVMKIRLRCRCGAVAGQLDTATGGLRAVCYCDDCQAYAHALARPDVLDAWGGTDIWQTAPSQVTITQGAGQIRCLRLAEQGLMRWHTGCCSTPIGNGLASARMPFIGLVHAFMELDPSARDAVLGPPTRLQGRYATGPVPWPVHPKVPLRLMARTMLFLLRGRLSGRDRPTPFFDAAGRPVVVPRVLGAAERQALRARVGKVG
jgi:Family of unknown function (DUF6151)